MFYILKSAYLYRSRGFFLNNYFFFSIVQIGSLTFGNSICTYLTSNFHQHYGSVFD